MNAVDTSVVVAAFASWHEQHDAARVVIDRGARLISHCGIECYAVLTRMPAPHRAPADIVEVFLRQRFPKAWLALPARQTARLLARLSHAGIAGGATYDALVAETARHAGAVLVTADRRAVRVYEAIGVPFQLLT